MVTFDITYAPKMNRVILNLKPRYENQVRGVYAKEYIFNKVFNDVMAK